MVSELEACLIRHVEAGTVPGAVALLGAATPTLVAAGVASVGGDPMPGCTVVRGRRPPSGAR